MRIPPIQAWLLCGLCVATTALPAHAIDIAGKKPQHVASQFPDTPNQQAIKQAIWAPGIDEGFVPQGMTWADGSVYISSYQSTNPKQDTGPCRLFKTNPVNGKLLGEFNLPAECGHAGGLAYIGNGIMVLSDTFKLYRIDLTKAFSPETSANAITATATLSGQVKGSFIDFDGRSLFVGSFERNATRSKGHFLPLSIFELPSGQSADERIALRTIPLPERAQGAAFDASGALWISSSSRQSGMLFKLDASTGKIVSQYESMIGIEDISFDPNGNLWSVSEAGSLRWKSWKNGRPVIFQISPNLLQ